MSDQISAQLTDRGSVPTEMFEIPGSSPSMEGSSIVVEDLWKVYGPKPGEAVEAFKNGSDSVEGHLAAVHGVSFEVSAGETFVVMGLSGSGKSTLIRCLTRLIEPTSGVVKVDGDDVLKLSLKELEDRRRRDWAMVFQHFGLLPHRRVLQNVTYPLEIAQVPRKKREKLAQDMVDLVGLSGTEGKFPHQLSGGMRQRVGLARALVRSPRLLLLDEPFSALDPLIRSDLQDELVRLAKAESQTSVFITHDFTEALKVGDRIAIMRDGKIVQIGTPEELVMNPADDYVRRFSREAPRARVVRASTIVQSIPEASLETTVDQAIHYLLKMEKKSLVVMPPSGSPFVVTADDLLSAHASDSTLAALFRATPVVSEDELLAGVMKELVESQGPVLVESSSGQLLGAIDHTGALEALTASRP